ncbi:MAG TPA: FtsX-like permease family protein, partial [Actinomycetota bacterium]|nr:FtsX-like permease family protein [Actinomycetota bacterium]
MQVLVGLVAILVVIVVFVAARAPVQRQLALRNGARRKSEAALVIAGSLLGTALITGSFIVGDTLDSSIRATARTQLGPIDEFVVVPDEDDAVEIPNRLRELNDARIDGVMTMVDVPGSVVKRTVDDVKAEPEAQIIEIDFEEARSFGGDPAATGISGDTPGPGEVALTEDLAETISAGTGDQISAFLYEKEIDLEVVRILPRLGIAGFWLGLESTSSNAFVAPGTVQSSIGDRLQPGALPPTTRVLISNRGGVEEGAALTTRVSNLIEEAIGTSTLRVESVKKDRLEAAEDQGAEFSELFLGIGSFAIVAGILLLINIFVMLAQERKSQLGMLRAIGLRRSDLVRVFVIEGFLYSIVAGILGAFLGIGVGWAIAKLAAPIFGGSDEFALELLFSMSPESIITGFCLGIIITSLTIFFTSVRISRINIIRAIRDLPEPTYRTVRKRTLILGGIFAAANVALFVMSLGNEDAWVTSLLCPAFAAFGLLPIITSWIRRRIAVFVVSGFSLAWGIFGNTLLGNQIFETGEIF